MTVSRTPTSDEEWPARVETFQDYFHWPTMRLFGLAYLVGISNGLIMTVVLVAMLAWSLTGPTQAIMAMSLVALFKFSNTAVASMSPVGTILFWLITMAASVRLYLSASRLSAPFLLLLAFGLVSILLSTLVSKAVDVSVMKVISFLIVSSALVVVANGLKAEEVLRLQRWFFSVVLAMALLSLLTIPFPGVAFKKVAMALQGMFSHPQTAGVFYAPFASWLIARVFLERLSMLPRWVIGMSILFASMIVASGARTAMLATFVSVGLTLLIFLVKGRTTAANRSRGQIVGFAMIMLSVSMAIFLSGVLNEELEAIALKGDDAESVTEAFESSRGAGIAVHIANFLDAPLTGHGFGVYREGVRGGEKHIVRFLGLPISASAEKGIVFTAVLEEVGIIGGVLFYLLLISIIAVTAKGNNPGVLAMVIGTIAVNFGEAIIFSTGGMGLFMWTVIGFGLARAGVNPPK